MNNILKFIIFATIALLVVGCKSSKQASTDSYTETASDAAGNFRLVVADYHDWHDVSMPVKLSLRQPSSMSVSGRARIIRSQSISISLRFLGMEVAQLYVDRDSIHATYRLKKLYISESLSEIKGDFPLSLENIQDLLLGQAFILGDSRLDSSDLKAVSFETPESGWNIIPDNAPQGINYGFRFSPDNLLSRCVAFTTDESTLAVAEYSDHQTTPAGILASVADISVTKGSRKIEAALSWNLGSAEWNTNFSNSWNAPKGYSRIRLSQLVKAISEN